MELALTLTAAGVLALGVSLGVNPIVMRVCHRRGWYDLPNERKIHTGPIPRLGGVSMFIGTITAALALPLLAPVVGAGAPVSYSLRYLPVLLGAILIHLVGLLDDFQDLRAPLKLVLQIGAAVLVTVGGFTISRIWLPVVGEVSLGILAWPVTILWIVAISNAINLVDGIDGLAGGIAAIAALFLGMMSLYQGLRTPSLLSFALAGSILGFLVYNLPPARIFMGDGGSLFLGFVLAVIPLVGTPGATSAYGMLPAATVLLVPILDTGAAIIRRTRERRPIQSPDKQHIHHKMLAIGVREPLLLFLVYGFCIYLGIAAFCSLFLERGRALVMLALVWATGLLVYWILSTRGQRRKDHRRAGLEGQGTR